MNNQTTHEIASSNKNVKSHEISEEFNSSARIERLQKTIRPLIHTDAITKVAPPAKKPRSYKWWGKKKEN